MLVLENGRLQRHEWALLFSIDIDRRMYTHLTSPCHAKAKLPAGNRSSRTTWRYHCWAWVQVIPCTIDVVRTLCGGVWGCVWSAVPWWIANSGCGEGWTVFPAVCECGASSDCRLDTFACPLCCIIEGKFLSNISIYLTDSWCLDSVGSVHTSMVFVKSRSGCSVVAGLAPAWTYRWFVKELKLLPSDFFFFFFLCVVFFLVTAAVTW